MRARSYPWSRKVEFWDTVTPYIYHRCLSLQFFLPFFFIFSFDYFHIQCIIFTTIATTKYYLFHDLYFHIYLHFIPYDLWHDGVAYCLHEFKSQKAKMFWGLIPTLVELQVKNR